MFPYVVCGAVIAGTLVFPFAGHSAFAQISERDAGRRLKAVVSGEFGAYRDEMKERMLAVAEKLERLLQRMESGSVSLGAPATDELEQILGEHLAEIFDATDGAERIVETLASGLLSQVQMVSVEGFVLGDHGTLDGFVAGLDKEVSKSREKLIRMLKKFTKATNRISKRTFRINVLVRRSGLPPPPRPSPVAAPAPPQKKLRIDAQVASSDLTVTGNGTLCVGGVAQPGAGDVTVRIVDPGGSSSQKVVPVDRSSTRWRVCFEALGKGNYTIFAQAGGQVDSGGIGIP